MVKPIWDVLVIGAGPAGSVTALELAKRNVSVLLVDKAAFPRTKVCGACLNAAALSILEQIGLGDLPSRLKARVLKKVILACAGHFASFSISEGAAVSREAFDQALIDEAVRAGVQFLPQTFAQINSVTDSIQVLLSQNGNETRVRTHQVVTADGLEGRSLENCDDFEFVKDPASLIGIGTHLNETPDFFESGTIFMACGKEGYVGAVQLEDGRLNMAAAIRPDFLKSAGPEKTVNRILLQAGFPLIEGLKEADWKGTVALTRKRKRIASPGIFIVGDSAGYVEPFTGEGIAFALKSAVVLAGFLSEKTAPHHWVNWHKYFIAGRQKRCWLVTRLLRSPRITQLLIGVLSHTSSFTELVAKQFSNPWT